MQSILVMMWMIGKLVVKSDGSGFSRLVKRLPYWIARGYFVAVFEVLGPGTEPRALYVGG